MKSFQKNIYSKSTERSTLYILTNFSSLYSKERFTRKSFENHSLLSMSLIKLYIIRLLMNITTGSSSPIFENSILNNNTIRATNTSIMLLFQKAYPINRRPDDISLEAELFFKYPSNANNINATRSNNVITNEKSEVASENNIRNSIKFSNDNVKTIVGSNEEFFNEYQTNFNSNGILRPQEKVQKTKFRYFSENYTENMNSNNNWSSGIEMSVNYSIIVDQITADKKIDSKNSEEYNIKMGNKNYNINKIFYINFQKNESDLEFSNETIFNNITSIISNKNSNIVTSNNTYDNLNFNKIRNNTKEKNYVHRNEKLENYGKLSSSQTVNSRFKVNEVFENAKKQNLNINKKDNITEGQSKGKIVILGLFELSTKNGQRQEGLSELGAAKMAVEHINKKQILSGYTIELLTNDTQCDPGVGVDRFFHALYSQHSTSIIMLLGSACSEVTESLAKVVPYWNIVQVSFGSTSPALSDRHEFPFFYRTVAPDSSHNPARIAFIRKFGWDTVTTLSQNEEVHSLAVNDLVTELESSNISCAATITFAETDFKEQLLLLKELDTRIIIGSFSKELAPKIFCEAYKLGMFGADYAWILHESMGLPWFEKKFVLSPWSLSNEKKSSTNKIKTASFPSSTTTASLNDIFYNTECLHKQLMEAVENLIIVSSHNRIVGNQKGLSGLDNEMFSRKLKELEVPEPLSKYASQTYDAVWTIALALRNAERYWKIQSKNQPNLNSFDYTRYDMAVEFLKQIGKLDFLGVSGPVSFSGPDRIGTTAFYQIQKGNLEPVALFYPAKSNLDFNCANCKSIKWHSGQVPIAKRIFKLRVVTIAPFAFYTIATISSFGIALSIAFLAFNLHFRKLKAIKLSSPKLSNITAFGCILVYMAVILLGLDFATLPKSEGTFPIVCTARVYLLSAGFSLAFGSMFAKTYRVHRIFTRTRSGVCKDKMLQDTQLISLVCALLILDGLVVTLWIVMDPIERHLDNLTLEISSTDRSVVYQPQVEVCRSQHTQGWLGVLYTYKGLLLIVGVYMAWETRHVKIPALNDSQYIGVSVYSVVITSAIVVVLANLISGRVTLAFITITTLILTSTTATLCLLFVPKLHDIKARNDVIDPVIHSMGLKMECNTRRFVIEDKRELQYRVEVQNRVYRRELLALDAEIHRLEKQLDTNSLASISSNTSIFHQYMPEINVTAEKNGSICFGATAPKSRTSSITGGLPYLLLSVLPPVIPRASWPSAEYMQVPMRRSVTFASHPHLEDKRSIAEVCLPAVDLFNLRLAHQQATAESKGGIINRIRSMFTRHSTSNRGSSSSLSNDQTGLRAAFKSHMGMFSRLIPSSDTTASCNALYDTNKTIDANSSLQNIGITVKSSTDIDRTPIDPKFSYFKTPYNEKCCFSVKAHEPRVKFQLPIGRRQSIAIQNNHPTLRERRRGSPRFPHRILPTCSLSALEEQDTPKVKTKLNATSGNWKSMDVPNMSSTISFEEKLIKQSTSSEHQKTKIIAFKANIENVPKLEKETEALYSLFV